MARELVFYLDGEVSNLPLARIDRDKLYGRKKRMVTDENGDQCSMAYLSSDGKTLVPSGGFSMLYVDEAGNQVERGELQYVNDDGEIVDKLPSTLGSECELYGPVKATRILDFKCNSIYALNAEHMGEKLNKALDNGDIFETEFRYMASVSTSTLFLLRNENGTFALICQAADFAFIQKESEEPIDVEDDEIDDDDLDFSF